MTKESCNVSEAVCLVAMNGIVVVAEALRECVGPFAMQLAEALAHVAVEFAIGALLRATFDNHVAKLDVLTFRYFEFEKLVHALFKVERGHDGEVDGASEVDEVCLGPIVDFELTLGIFLTTSLVVIIAFVGTSDALAVGIGVAVVAIRVLTEDLCLDGAVAVLVFDEFGILLENVETLLDIELVVQTDAMGDLVLLFDEVERLGNAWVVFECFTAYLREHLDHVLHTFADLPFIKDSSEAIEDAVVRLRRFFSKEGADLAHEADGDLDTVVGRLLEKEHQNLEGKDLVDDPLADKMRDEHGGRVADCLVVALEGTSELRD